MTFTVAMQHKLRLNILITVNAQESDLIQKEKNQLIIYIYIYKQSV